MRLGGNSYLHHVLWLLSSGLLGFLNLNGPTTSPLSFIGDPCFSAVHHETRSGLGGSMCGAAICGNYVGATELTGIEALKKDESARNGVLADAVVSAGKILNRLDWGTIVADVEKYDKSRNRKRRFSPSAETEVGEGYVWSSTEPAGKHLVTRERPVYILAESREGKKEFHRAPREHKKKNKRMKRAARNNWEEVDVSGEPTAVDGSKKIKAGSKVQKRAAGKWITDKIKKNVGLSEMVEDLGEPGVQMAGLSVADAIYKSGIGSDNGFVDEDKETVAGKLKRELGGKKKNAAPMSSLTGMAGYGSKGRAAVWNDELTRNWLGPGMDPRTYKRKTKKSERKISRSFRAGNIMMPMDLRAANTYAVKSGRSLMGAGSLNNYGFYVAEDRDHGKAGNLAATAGVETNPSAGKRGMLWEDTNARPEKVFGQYGDVQKNLWMHERAGEPRMSKDGSHFGASRSELFADGGNQDAKKPSRDMKAVLATGKRLRIGKRLAGDKSKTRSVIFRDMNDDFPLRKDRERKSIIDMKGRKGHEKLKTAVPLKGARTTKTGSVKQLNFHKPKSGKGRASWKTQKVIAKKREKSKGSHKLFKSARKLGSWAAFKDTRDASEPETRGDEGSFRQFGHRLRRFGFIRRILDFLRHTRNRRARRRAGWMHLSETDSADTATSEEIAEDISSSGTRSDEGTGRRLSGAPEATGGQPPKGRQLGIWGFKPHDNGHHDHHKYGSWHGGGLHGRYSSESDDYFEHRLGLSNYPHLDVNWNRRSGHHLDWHKPHHHHHGHHRTLQDASRRNREEKLLASGDALKRGIEGKAHEKRRQSVRCGRTIKVDGCENDAATSARPLSSLKKAGRGEWLGDEGRHVALRLTDSDLPVHEKRSKLVKEGALRSTAKKEGAARKVGGNNGNAATRLGLSDQLRGRARPLLSGRLSIQDASHAAETEGDSVTDAHVHHLHGARGGLLHHAEDAHLGETRGSAGGPIGMLVSHQENRIPVEDDNEMGTAWEEKQTTHEYFPVTDENNAITEGPMGHRAAAVYSFPGDSTVDLSN